VLAALVGCGERTYFHRKKEIYRTMVDASFSSITIVRPDEGQMILPELIHLLQDTVAGGASIGFLPPLSEEEARQYWNTVLQDVAQGTQVLLVARDAGRVVGSVQLALATKPNALHRAEVQKLFVLRSQRGRGTGRALMLAVEQTARDQGRSLLVLDTRPGDVADQLYRKLGYQEVGVIPTYVRNAAGAFEGTVVFYKALERIGA
jgi:acetyltransferase